MENRVAYKKKVYCSVSAWGVGVWVQMFTISHFVPRLLILFLFMGYSDREFRQGGWVFENYLGRRFFFSRKRVLIGGEDFFFQIKNGLKTALSKNFLTKRS